MNTPALTELFSSVATLSWRGGWLIVVVAALRVAVRELEWQWLADDVCALQFALRAGSFATAVVRELLALDGAATQEEQG